MENLIEDLLKELTSELYELTAPELEEIRREWIEQLREASIPAKVIAFCDELCSQIIKQKREKEGIMG